MKKRIVFLISTSIILALFVISCSQTYTQQPVDKDIAKVVVNISNKSNGTKDVVVEDNISKPNEYNVKILEKGFSPDSLSIKEGDLVVFTNDDLINPIHLVSGIKKNNGVRILSSRLDYLENFSYQFNVSGEYTFFDVSIQDQDEREQFVFNVVIE